MQHAQPITLNVAKALLPARPTGAHKGTFGHLYVLAGSRGFTGAARLCCEAAYRSGAGLVTLGVPRPLADVMASVLVETMTHPLPATPHETFAAAAVEPALSAAATKSAVAIGPGLSQHDETARFVHAILHRCQLPCVIDADALNALRGDATVLKTSARNRVVTPHPGEMARLLGCDIATVQRDRAEVAGAFARESACVVVLKGAATIVASPDGEIFANTTGNSGLATGGTGDVLTGMIGGLLAQGMSARDAAVVGVFVHGLAGDMASKEFTRRSMIARDVIAYLPRAWKELGEV